MASAPHSTGLGWGTRLLLVIALLLAGAAGAAWALARYDQAAQFLGIGPKSPPGAMMPSKANAPQKIALVTQPAAESQEIEKIEDRLQQVETTTERVEGSAGRADALLVAFAARRAVDRGLALGYLEPLLLDRFGRTHPRAVATIVTGSHAPVRLNDLVRQYRELGPVLRSSAPTDGWLSQFQRELGSLVQIRRADRPSTQPDARYLRALSALENGEVDIALAETMRLPGAGRAEQWVRQARQYVAVQRALDEIESGALLARTHSPAA